MLAQTLRCPRRQHILDLAALDSKALRDIAQHVRTSVAWMVVYLESDCAALAVARLDLDAEEEAMPNAPALVG